MVLQEKMSRGTLRTPAASRRPRGPTDGEDSTSPDSLFPISSFLEATVTVGRGSLTPGEDGNEPLGAEAEEEPVEEMANISYLSEEGSAVSVDMRPVIRRKNKRGAKRCERPDCPFCTRPNCGACRNCVNPAFKSKCIKRKALSLILVYKVLAEYNCLGAGITVLLPVHVEGTVRDPDLSSLRMCR
jgi:hypothetical protein